MPPAEPPTQQLSDQSKGSDLDQAEKLDDAKTVGGSSDSDARATAGKTEHFRIKDLVAADPSTEVFANTKYRTKWYQLWRPKDPPPPPPASLGDAAIIPLATASLWSVLTYQWITPIMKLGYQRPLQATDLWAMDASRQADPLTRQLFAAYERRKGEAREYNEHLAAGKMKPPLQKRVAWAIGRGGPGTAAEKEARWRDGEGRKKASLLWSLNELFFVFFWSGGLFKVAGDTAQLMGPLITRQIILFAQERSNAKANPADFAQPNIGRGVAMAIGLFLITVFASVCTHAFFWRSMSTAVLARAALTTAIYRISMVISQKERTHLSNGKLMSHLSTDVSRVDFAGQWFHAIWTAPIQIVICAILLITQIGPSALVGIALFLLLIPVQQRIMAAQFVVRKGSMKWTDARSRLLQELLGSFSIIKLFTLELPFLERISDIRREELVGIRKILLIKAANQAIAMSLPTLAAVVSFLCYVGTGNELDPARIFTALSFFQLLRQPLMFLPRALSAIVDAATALERLSVVFEAETLEVSLNIDPQQKFALDVRDASFEWTASAPQDDKAPPSGKGKANRAKKEASKQPAPVEEDAKDAFKIDHLSMRLERGSLCAMVGAVGSGKSSILNGLIGEMKQTGGSCTFGGVVAYASQSAFIQNASLRDNVVFGQPWDEERYWKCIQDSGLIADCEQLADGDLSEIGEKGITLSGGQRQRVNVARALYHNADVVIFDDPLSAVDAGVAQSLWNDAMKGLRAEGKTVLLVTHALHILPEADYIYCIEDGRIAEEGTYAALMDSRGAFSRLVEEHGGLAKEEDEEDEVEEQDAIQQLTGQDIEIRTRKLQHQSAAAGTGKLEGRLMRGEKRHTGSVSRTVYGDYARAGRGGLTIPLVLSASVFMQASQILSSVWLVWWRADHFSKSLGFYMSLYAFFGMSQACWTFLMGGSLAVLSAYASKGLLDGAVLRLFHAPMSLFNSTPLGRIMSVLGKDIDIIDSQLADSLRMSVMTFGNVLGSTILIAIYFPYFLIAVACILLGYAWFAAYYRSSAREMKRLDSILRSLLYSHFSESLSGLATIRAYGESSRFIRDNSFFVDLENRALYLTVTNQRWLAIRLDMLGGFMAFAVGLMCVLGVNGITAAEAGLVLSFTVSLTQQFGMITRQSAEVENNMNAVERVTYYSSDKLEQEAPHEIADAKPSVDWPSQGSISFNNVVMAYRPGLPDVLKGVSIEIRAGEKLGIIGRTGSGKSSLLQALFRMVELRSGSIYMDRIDIAKLGLRDLRAAISILPQDPLLFSGTIRSNLDPFSRHTDLELWSALRRSYLVPAEAPSAVEGEKVAAGRFNLETPVDEDGANLSVGERGLVSLARALVKDSKVMVLDEATASVDLETDGRIQQTISQEFAHKTVIAIAHRLRTILSYDRILVLDAGQVAEFDTPLALFLKEGGHFRAMCDKSAISEQDIIKAQG